MIIKAVNKILGPFGYRIQQKEAALPPDLADDQAFLALYEKCRPFTMTTIERMYALYTAVNYIADNQIPGDLVECGVWRGGSSMLMAQVLLQRGLTDRRIYLYDTFAGMSEPTEMDKTSKGVQAATLLEKEDRADAASVWCYADLNDVTTNLRSTGFPEENLVYIKGKVEDTLPHNRPGELALLRLDTDWYESTKIELELLYPLLRRQGILIIDDFGFWEGAKKAVVEYFGKMAPRPFLHRIDFTGRLIIK